MRIHLMRHGIAADANDPRFLSDAERPLTELGVARTTLVARGLAAAEVAPERVLVSPLLRARQTAEIVLHELRLPAASLHETEALIYDRVPDELLGVLAELRPMEALCIGHAPLLDRVLARLVHTTGRPFTRMRMAGLATLHAFPPWQMPGELVSLVTPEILRALGGDPDLRRA